MKTVRAFTLIELLVVITIIAVIAALLFPTLSSSKNLAAKTADLNNLGQIITALNVYTDDNNDVLTWPNWDYGRAMPDGTARAGWLYTPEPVGQRHERFQSADGLALGFFARR